MGIKIVLTPGSAGGPVALLTTEEIVDCVDVEAHLWGGVVAGLVLMLTLVVIVVLALALALALSQDVQIETETH